MSYKGVSAYQYIQSDGQDGQHWWSDVLPDAIDEVDGYILGSIRKTAVNDLMLRYANHTIAKVFYVPDSPFNIDERFLNTLRADLDKHVCYDLVCCLQPDDYCLYQSRRIAIERLCDPKSWPLGRPIRSEWISRFLPSFKSLLGHVEQSVIDKSWENQGFFLRLQVSLTGIMLYNISVFCEWALVGGVCSDDNVFKKEINYWCRNASLKTPSDLYDFECYYD